MSEDLSVSVIVCTYNRAEQLPRIIRLLRVQDYPKDRFEIIIVDNGSTDNTKSMAEKLMTQSDVKIRYFFESRRGVTFARNRGSEEALYPYLAYIDDDCIVKPDWLQSLMTGYDLDNRVFSVFGRIKNDWGEQIKPRWMTPAMEAMLGDNSFLGTAPKILENRFGTRESNLSIKKGILQSLGGFLGMEQFGSHNSAATELKYCLWKARNIGVKIAYVPTAVAHHYVTLRTKSWMIKRAYWQGISDGLLDFIIYRQKWWKSGIKACSDSAAMIVLFGFALFYLVLCDQPRWMFHLLRAVRRFGLILSELHLKGNWSRVNAWLAGQSF
jgi:glycosyltransferase involved in cell wall biosynthesis